MNQPEAKPIHIQQGQAAIMIDAMGADVVSSMFLCRISDRDEFSMIASTILLVDQERWIRHLPRYQNAVPDQHSMRISPQEGVNIIFERHVMTMDGFVPSREIDQYHVRKLQETYLRLSEEGKLFVMEG